VNVVSRYGCPMLEHIAPEVLREAQSTAQSAQERSGVVIRSLETSEENLPAREIFDLVWPPIGGGTQVPPNLLRAITHAGGYCSAAFVVDGSTETPVGAALGVLGVHETSAGPHMHIHSHMAGVLDEHRNRRIGTALKQHQRMWALERGIDTVVWTFDPLVARNARLNLVNLGVTVRGYEPNFYGAMSDSINAGDESDRVFAWWDLAGERAQAAARGELLPIDAITAEQCVIETPDDIVALRSTDPVQAQEWRKRMRLELMREFAAGKEIIGVTRSGDYVLEAR
jgi:predicted GNAT superfamily acetyltransferase